MKDYYKILGVPENASQEEIRRRYRELVKKYHPDISKDPDAAKKMAEINEAYQVLSDPKKRAEYDRLRKFGGAFGGSPSAGYGYDYSTPFGGFPFEDIFNMFGSVFEDFFGTQTRRPKRRVGTDIRHRIHLSLKEAILGTEKKVTVKRWKICPHCHGTGASSPDKVKTCPTCGGTGYVRQTKAFGGFMFSTQTVCPTCRGTGKVIEEPCPVCGGRGVVYEAEDITVKIPPGVRPGNVIKIRGKGNEVPGGMPGNLLIEVDVDMGDFKLERDHLIYEAQVPYPIMILGGEIEVPLPEGGKRKVSLREGIQPGDTVRVDGAGWPRGGRRGPLIVRINPYLPTRPSQKERQLLEEIAKLYGSEPPKGGFFGNFFGRRGKGK